MGANFFFIIFHFKYPAYEGDSLEYLYKYEHCSAQCITVFGHKSKKLNSSCKRINNLGIQILETYRTDNRLILLYKGLKGKARIHDLIPKTRRCRNSHSVAFQLPSANKEAFKCSFFSRTIRDWNDLPDSLFPLLKCQMIEFASLVQSRD